MVVDVLRHRHHAHRLNLVEGVALALLRLAVLEPVVEDAAAAVASAAVILVGKLYEARRPLEDASEEAPSRWSSRCRRWDLELVI